jgi:nitrite reductase/ring-hydroxylating ferredoxin subunit
MASWCPLVPFSSLVDGRGQVVDLGSRGMYAVVRVGPKVHVLDNRCPHRDGDLGVGDVKDGLVYCPLHAWPFDLTSGQCTRYPRAQVRVYECRIEGDNQVVEALLDEPAAPTEEELYGDEP